jgi:hypothetical protein
MTIKHTLLLSIIAFFLIQGCGSEAKFHSVYNYETEDMPKVVTGVDYFKCGYTMVDGEKRYVCEEISPDECLKVDR